MKLYTAQREYDYEGFDILGIFSTREAALECCAKDISPSGRVMGDRHEVEEFELNKEDLT